MEGNNKDNKTFFFYLLCKLVIDISLQQSKLFRAVGKLKEKRSAIRSMQREWVKDMMLRNPKIQIFY